MLVETSDKNVQGGLAQRFFAYSAECTGLAVFCTYAPEKKTSQIFVVMMSADAKNAMPVLYSYMSRKIVPAHYR